MASNEAHRDDDACPGIMRATALCPWHTGVTPSLVIDCKTGRVECLSCGAIGMFSGASDAGSFCSIKKRALQPWRDTLDDVKRWVKARFGRRS